MESGGDLMVGAVIDYGRFKLEELIEENEQIQRFRARQISTNRSLTIKVPRGAARGDRELAARFEAEARCFTRLKHPNIVSIIDFGRLENGAPYIATELLSGRRLSALLKATRQLELPHALGLMEQVCEAMAEAHRAGVVHRDLKPDNLQIESSSGHEYVKVIGFDIAEQIGGEGVVPNPTGGIFGTPHYMSPEQVYGEPVDRRADVYSLGVILYEMLAGGLPFEGETPMAVMMAKVSEPAPDIRRVRPDLGVSDEVAGLIKDALAREREARLVDAEEMLARVRSIRAVVDPDSMDDVIDLCLHSIFNK